MSTWSLPVATNRCTCTIQWRPLLSYKKQILEKWINIFALIKRSCLWLNTCYNVKKSEKSTDRLILGPSTFLPRINSWLPSIVLSVCRSLRVIYCPLINPNGILLAETVFLLMLTQSSLSCIRLCGFSHDFTLSFPVKKLGHMLCVDRHWEKQRSLSWQLVLLIWKWHGILETFPKLLVYRLWQHGDSYSPGLCSCHLSSARSHWLMSHWNDSFHVLALDDFVLQRTLAGWWETHPSC